jgi:hypothetical protein
MHKLRVRRSGDRTTMEISRIVVRRWFLTETVVQCCIKPHPNKDIRLFFLSLSIQGIILPDVHGNND